MLAVPILDKPYEIKRKLGSGTYSDVYLAYDFENKRDVVVKVFESEKVWREVYARRNQLMSIKSALTPEIYSVEVLAGYGCIIEEYICGESLTSLINANKLTYRMFFKLCFDLLDALSVLHNMRLVHGDIKPQNVIVDITDGGLTGYLIDIDSAVINQTCESAFFGTLYYAAPEQVIDNKFMFSTDIYSLGLLACVILEGRLPYEQTREGIGERINRNGIPPLSNMQSESLKDDLWKILCSMTDKVPARRPTIGDIKRKLKLLEFEHFNTNEMDLLIRKEPSTAEIPIAAASYWGKTCPAQAFLGTYMVSMYPLSFMVAHDAEHFSKQEREVDEALKMMTPIVLKETQRTYQKHLLKEYEQLSKQAVISFWLWVTTFVMGLVLIIYAVCLIAQGKYVEALTSVVLEALVYFAQRLFAVREEYYRKQNDSKIKHLEVGDYYEYLMSILETTDEEYRKQKLDMVLESIKKQTERLSVTESDT